MYYRLKCSSEFKKLYSSGKKSFANGMMMLYTSSKTLKMGISVGKKYGGSVKRNKIKRLIRAAFFEVYNNVGQNVNIIFIPKAGFLHTFENVSKSISYLLKKEGLLKNA